MAINEIYLKPVDQQKNEFSKWFAAADWSIRRYDIINYLIKKNNFKKYLEIGINDGDCFKRIDIEHKDSVDPQKDKYVKFVMTSDQFFSELEKDFKYDIILVDGLHTDQQVYKDVINSLKHLEENGIIVCHDINPPFEICQRKHPVIDVWNGDSWKAFVKLRSERNDLEMYTIDTDWGVGIIKRGHQKTVKTPDDLYYAYLERNRKVLLNLISFNEFKNKV